MPAAKSNEGIFPFFDLPRELRNAIYRELKQPKTVFRNWDAKLFWSSGLDVRIERPIRNLGLVSRQFKQEYKGQILASATIFLKSYGDVTDPFYESISSKISKAAHVDILLLDHCYCGICEFQSARQCEATARMPKIRDESERLLENVHGIRSATIKILVQLHVNHPEWSSLYDVQNMPSEANRLTDMTRVKALEVRHVLGIDELHRMWQGYDDIDNVLWATWHEKGGWQEVDEEWWFERPM